MWTIKPQTIYVMGGRMKVEFRARKTGACSENNGHYTMDVTEGGLTCRVRFSSGGEVIRIEKLTPDAAKPT